jgi:hypothetical protein
MRRDVACAPGYCAETPSRVGDCAAGRFGSWRTRENGIHSLADCVRQCLQCSRCRFVSLSLSPQHEDCSWYHSCDLRSLTAPPVTGPDFVSADLRQFDAALPECSTSNKTISATPSPVPAVIDQAEFKRRLQRAHAKLSRVPASTALRTQRVALLLHGKLGTWTASSEFSRAGSTPDTLVRLAHSSLHEFVLAPSARRGVICDLFVHSWNPEVGPLLDELYRPLRSAHEAPHPTNVSFTKVHSQMLSLRSALRWKRQVERADGFEYGLVLMLRSDLVFRAPLEPGMLDSSRVWLLHECCNWGPRERMARCGGRRGHRVVHCSVRRWQMLVGVEMEKAVDDNYFVNDWIWAMDSARADTVAQIFGEYAAYRAMLLGRRISYEWAHFFLAAHVHDVMRATADVRFFPGLEAHSTVRLARELAAHGGDCTPHAADDDRVTLRADATYELAQINPMQAACPYEWGGAAGLHCECGNRTRRQSQKYDSPMAMLTSSSAGPSPLSAGPGLSSTLRTSHHSRNPTPLARLKRAHRHRHRPRGQGGHFGVK